MASYLKSPIRVPECQDGITEIAPVTDEDGVYKFPAIPPGTFYVAVHDGQGSRLALQCVEVRSGETSKLDFVLGTLP